MKEERKDHYNNPVQATLTGIANLFRKQEKAGELTDADRLDGKTALVDGSSSGLGLAIATELARRGARVIMACRSGIPVKGDLVKKRSGSANVYMLPVDLSDTESILRLVSAIHQEFAPIDILVCNAGVVPRKSRKTIQGLEEMFMVNYFSKFLFVNLLLKENCFRKPGSGKHGITRIIFVASETHRNPKGFNWESFGIYKEYSIGRSIELYGYYKLLLTTFAAELSRRLNRDKAGFSVFALCPGPVNTNIGREAPAVFQPLMKLVFSIFFRSPAKAATPVIYLAASRDVEGKPFDYLFLMSRKQADEKARDPENGKRLWALSETLAAGLGINFDPAR
jgi:NAD(P)-dependent dehydrogenase (short-subunit alcohol dehydrogenase family)